MPFRFLLLLLAACGGEDPSDTGRDTPTGTPTPTSPLPTTTDETVPTEDQVLSQVTASVHPTYGSILVVSWTQAVDATVHLEFSFETDVWMSSPERMLSAGAHEEFVLGVPFDTEITWRVVADAAGEPAASIDTTTRTGSLPPGLPRAMAAIEDPIGWDAAGAPFLFTTVGRWDDPWWILIYDRQLRPVWAERSAPQHLSMHSRVARDAASLFIDQNSFWATFDLDAGYVEQKTLDGALVATFATPGSHHPITDLPDGSVAYGAISSFYSPERLQIVHPDGTFETLWSCSDWMASIGINETCTSNTLNYDEASDTFLFSFYSLDTIVEIDGTSGLATRWFGHVPGAYLFDPVESAFWWQHGGHITATGTLLTSSDLTRGGVETVIREYEIDDVNQTLREVWSFGVGDGVFGAEMGEAERLPNGNTWHNYGQLPRLREATPDGTVVWDVSWDTDAIGRTMPISDLYAMAGVRP